MNSNRKAELLLEVLEETGDDAFVEIRIWRVPTPVRGSDHSYKYSLALVVEDICVMRYDNEAGKGDHKHIGKAQMPYFFTTVDKLIADFWMDVDQWLEN